MRKAAFIASFITALGVTCTQQVPTASAQGYNWTGVHFGVLGTFARGYTDWTYTLVPPVTLGHSSSGTLFGGTLGADFQTGNVLFGIEGDWSVGDIEGSSPCPNPAFNCRSNIDSFATVRGRLGHAVGPFMIYLTGGWAFADVRAETVFLAGAAIPPSGTPVNGSTVSRSGPIGGIGVMFGLMSNVSGKAEVLRYDFGTSSHTVDNNLPVDLKTSGTLFRMGFNYHFNWGPPPAP